jgi:hypothetical protein
MQVWTNRQLGFHHRDLAKALESYVARHERLPPAKSYAEMLEMVRADLGAAGKWSDLWAAAYQPEYHRFDTGEARRVPIVEWNASLATAPWSMKRQPETVWVIRSKSVPGYARGLTWQIDTAIFEWEYRASKLGYEAAPEDDAAREGNSAAR